MVMAQKIITSNSVSRSDFAILERASRDIFYFASLAWVRHPVRGRVRFELYPYQKRVLWEFLTRRFNIVLKFRQAGLTELIAFCGWQCFTPTKISSLSQLRTELLKGYLQGSNTCTKIFQKS